LHASHHLTFELGNRANAEANQLGDFDYAEPFGQLGSRLTQLFWLSTRTP
jgi:hypothetical protein